MLRLLEIKTPHKQRHVIYINCHTSQGHYLFIYVKHCLCIWLSQILTWCNFRIIAQPRRSGAGQIVWLVLSVFYLLKLVVRFVYNKANSGEMAFYSDPFLRGVFFFAVGAVSSVAILKIWENRESLLREIRRRFDSNETQQPEEHDERFD